MNCQNQIENGLSQLFLLRQYKSRTGMLVAPRHDVGSTADDLSLEGAVRDLLPIYGDVAPRGLWLQAEGFYGYHFSLSYIHVTP